MALADKFFTIEHSVLAIYSRMFWSIGWILGREILSNYCLFVALSLFDKEESFPLEDGRIVGNYSTFFNEFFRIRLGRFVSLDDSDSRKEAKDSRVVKIGLIIPA